MGRDLGMDDRVTGEIRRGLRAVHLTAAPAQIREYVATGEPMGKAGAYAIQGRAAAYISHISGSYSGIMGLPMHETANLLRTLKLVP